MKHNDGQHAVVLPEFDLAVASRFVAAAGLVLDAVGTTYVRGHLDLGTEHHTPWGIVHGGVYGSAIESAASIGASALWPTGLNTPSGCTTPRT